MEELDAPDLGSLLVGWNTWIGHLLFLVYAVSQLRRRSRWAASVRRLSRQAHCWAAAHGYTLKGVGARELIAMLHVRNRVEAAMQASRGKTP